MDKVRFLMSDTGAQITAACREALEQKGVEVTVVEKDGNKVLQKMLSVRPQVVLLDAFMPGLDALAVKQRYNAAGERHTSFFVTGAFQSEEMVQELLDEGFAYYFVKPFDENVLASRVLKVALGQEKRVLHTSVDSDELTVTEILHQIGVPAHIKGYQFLRDAILLTMNEPEYIKSGDQAPVPGDRQAQRHHRQPGGARYPPCHRGGMGPGRCGYPEQLLRLHHPQPARKAHQQRVHCDDRRQDAAG